MKALSWFLYWFAESSVSLSARSSRNARSSRSATLRRRSVWRATRGLPRREQRVGDVGFLGRLAYDDERNRPRGLLLDLRDIADRRRQAVGEEAEELGS